MADPPKCMCHMTTVVRLCNVCLQTSRPDLRGPARACTCTRAQTSQLEPLQGLSDALCSLLRFLPSQCVSSPNTCGLCINAMPMLVFRTEHAPAQSNAAWACRHARLLRRTRQTSGDLGCSHATNTVRARGTQTVACRPGLFVNRLPGSTPTRQADGGSAGAIQGAGQGRVGDFQQLAPRGKGVASRPVQGGHDAQRCSGALGQQQADLASGIFVIRGGLLGASTAARGRQWGGISAGSSAFKLSAGGAETAALRKGSTARTLAARGGQVCTTRPLS